MAPYLIPKKKTTSIPINDLLFYTIYNKEHGIDLIYEKYDRIGTKNPSLVPTEVTVNTDEGPLLEIRYLNPQKHTPHPRVHAVDAEGNVATGPIEYKGWKAHRIGMLKSIKKRANDPAFLDKAPFNHTGFSIRGYLERLRNEVDERINFLSGQSTKPPLREIIDIRNPNKYKVLTFTNLQAMISSPLYQRAKGNNLVYDKVGSIVRDENGTPIAGEKLKAADFDSAQALVDLALFRHGYRSEKGYSPKTAFQNRAEKDPELFQYYVEKGAKDIIKQLADQAKRAGWNPGIITEQGYAQNPLHLAVVGSKTSFNMIPAALANTLEKYSVDHDKNGKEGYFFAADDSISKSNTAKRTSSNKQFRFFQQAEFEGPVIPNTHYAIIDDVMTTGSTFLNVGGHIAAHGGIVSGCLALANSSSGAHMVPTEHIYELNKGKITEEVSKEIQEAEENYSTAQTNYTKAVRMGDTTAQKEHQEQMKVNLSRKEEAQKTLNEIGNNKDKSYEHLLTYILNENGSRELEGVLKKRVGLTYLTMTQRELLTLKKMLSYVTGKGGVWKQHAGYVLADIISTLDFDKIDRKLKATSFIKEEVSRYKNTHDASYVNTLPRKIQDYLTDKTASYAQAAKHPPKKMITEAANAEDVPITVVRSASKATKRTSKPLKGSIAPKPEFVDRKGNIIQK